MKLTAPAGYVLAHKDNQVFGYEVYIADDDMYNWRQITEQEAKELEAKILPLVGSEGLRADKIAEITQADKAASVFYVNNIPMWLDKELRNSLLNVTLPALKAVGETTTELWYEGIPPVPITVPIDLLSALIPQLELYAKRVYDNTNRLKGAVYGLEGDSEIEAFEITGYPEPLKFDL